MSPLNRELVRYNDNLYEVIRKHPESRIKAGRTDDFRQLIKCDITLKKEGMLYFCRQIQEAVIVE